MKQDLIRIVHVTSSLAIGGAETLLCTIIEHLPKNFEHHVIYFHDGPRRKNLEDLDIPTYQIRGAITLYDPIFFIRLYQLIKQLKPNHIHALLWAANISTRLIAHYLKIPCTNVYHNNVDQDGYIRNLIDRLTISYTQKIVAVSPAVAQTIVQNSPNLEKKNISIIKNGIDAHTLALRAMQESITRNQLKLEYDLVIIGSVGRFEPVKNYPLLIHSFAQIWVQKNNVHLILIGYGSQEQQLRKLARELRITNAVSFIINQPAYHYYSLFDIFVQSSENEGISLALLEAMSCKRPCIVTAINQQHSVITNNKNGLVIMPGNIQKLTHALQILIQNNALRRKFGDEAWLEICTNFNQQKMINDYQKLFSQFQ